MLAMSVQSNHEDLFADWISPAEIAFCRQILDRLDGQPWARRLTEAVRGLLPPEGRPNNPVPQLRSYLFELQIANALHLAGIVPQYEFKTGNQFSSVDFRFSFGGLEWLVEAVNPQVSEGIRDATKFEEILPGITEWKMELSSNNPEQSIEQEVCRLQREIAGKVLSSSGRHRKFPSPEPGRGHLVVVDTRTFLGNGEAEMDDFWQIMFGPRAVSNPHFVLCWPPRSGQYIVGLYENGCTQPGSSIFRERIHCVVFTRIQAYQDGAIFRGSVWAVNPHLAINLEALSNLRDMLVADSG